MKTYIDVIYRDSTILICFKMFDVQVDAVQQFKITSDKVVTGIYNYLFFEG